MYPGIVQSQDSWKVHLDTNDFSSWVGAGNHTFTSNPSGAPDGGPYQTITKNATSVLYYSDVAPDGNLILTLWFKNPQNYPDTSAWQFLVYNSTIAGTVDTFLGVQSNGSLSGITVANVKQIGDWFRAMHTITPTDGVGYSPGDSLNFYAQSGGNNLIGGSIDLWGYVVKSRKTQP